MCFSWVENVFCGARRQFFSCTRGGLAKEWPGQYLSTLERVDGVQAYARDDVRVKV
jgi:hypothetical protein